MPTTETTYRVKVAPSSSLRMELNILAAVVAVGICLVILALLANTPPPGAVHHAPRSAHAQPRALANARATSWK